MKHGWTFGLAGLSLGGLLAVVSPYADALGEDETVEMPVEHGNVDWLRDYDTAVQQAIDERKPLFVLFQEVPG